MDIIPSTLYFYNSYPSKLFHLKANKEGIYTISYSLRGVNRDVFEVPELTRVIVVNNLESGSVGTVNILTPGCHSAGGLIYQCPYSANTVSFTSSCSWQSEVNGDQITDGVVFASSDGLTLPVSIAGAKLTGLLTGNIGNNLPFTKHPCHNFTNLYYGNQNCSSYNFSASDMVYILSRQLLQLSFLEYIDTILPNWLSLSVNPLNLSTMASFSFDDYSTILTTNQTVSSCENLQLVPNRLHSVIRFTDLKIQIFDSQYKYESAKNDSICIAVNLCYGKNSPVYFSLPPNSETFIRQFKMFEVSAIYFQLLFYFLIASC